MAVDVVQAAVGSAVPAFRAVCGHVVVSTAHVPGAEVADDRGAQLWGASVSPVTVLGGVHHAVDLAGAGGWASGGWLGSFLMPAGSKESNREALVTQLENSIPKKNVIFDTCQPSRFYEYRIQNATSWLKQTRLQADPEFLEIR